MLVQGLPFERTHPEYNKVVLRRMDFEAKKPKDFSCLLIVFWGNTVPAPLIAAASNQKIFSGQLAVVSIQEQLLIKKYFYTYSEIELESI